MFISVGAKFRLVFEKVLRFLQIFFLDFRISVFE